MASALAPQPQAQAALSRYLTEDPKKIYQRNTLKPVLINGACAIAALAAIAITGGILASYLGLLGASTISGWAVLGSMTGTALLTGYVIHEVFPKFDKEIEIQNRYAKFAIKLNEIVKWNEASLNEFLSTHEINTNEYTPEYMALLKEKEPNTPLKALLPLIARYLVMVDQAEEASKIAVKEKAKLTDPKMNKDEYRKHAHLELSHKTEAAWYLQCLKKPHLTIVPTTEVDQAAFVKEILRTPNAEMAELDLLSSTNIRVASIIYFLKRTLLTEKSKRDMVTDAGFLQFKTKSAEQIRFTLFELPAIRY